MIQGEDSAKVKQEGEGSFPNELFGAFESKSNYFCHLWVHIEVLVLSKLAKIILNVSSSLIVLVKLHVKVPVDILTVVKESLLYLFWIQEVEVCSKKFTPKLEF